MWLFFGKIKEKNMKKIYLIRHAKAVKKGDDFERKLSKSGKDELKKLFKKLLISYIFYLKLKIGNFIRLPL